MSKKILLALVLLLAAAPLGAAAQDGNQSDTANNATAPESVVQVDTLTVVSDYELRNGDLWIEFRSEGGNTLSITETAQSDGATQVRVRTVDIPRGTSTVTVNVFDSAQASVLITSRLSLQQNSGTTLAVDSADPLIAGPFTATDAQAAGVGAGLGVAITTLYMVAKVVYGRNEQPERMA